jgi:peptidase M28-like protein
LTAVDPLTEIEDLVAHEERGPGTDAERRAARHLVGRLRAIGRDAGTEATSVLPKYALTHLIHTFLALGGSLIAATADSDVPRLVGTGLVLIAAISAFGDLTGSFHLARRLTGRRASQNVISREELGKPGTLVLVAHYDAAHSGAVFNDRALRRRARLGRFLHREIGPFEPLFWSIMAVLICCALRLVGVEGVALNAVQFVPTIVLIVAVPLLVDIMLSPVVPGAGDNASGVATVLRLADRYGEELDSFDVWVLLTGAQESMQLGMAAFLKRHRRELDRESTVFVCVDDVGRGRIRYATREGYVVAYPYHPDLVAICEQLRAEDAEEDYYGVQPVSSRSATDAHRARVAGYPAIAIGAANEHGYPSHYHQSTDTTDTIDPDALERAYEFCAELIELIDERIGPQLAVPAEQASR